MLRQDIISCFSDITCFLMPHPGLVATTTQNFQGKPAGIYKLQLLLRFSLVLTL